MSSGNWSSNPYNMEGSLKQHVLPKVLFEECHKNCVDFDFAAPKNDAELKCISNCQSKTYQAFNMQMRVAYNMERNKTTRDFVDYSKYTGMEVEHGLNTANLHPMNSHSNVGHFDPNSNL